MKLSEAIRLGSMLVPQCFGRLFDFADIQHRTIRSACAFGAARLAINAVHDEGHVADIWPWLSIRAICPACGHSCPSNAYVISEHLNDDHRWTREQIADWVASVEPSGSERQQDHESARTDAAVARDSKA